MRDRRLFIGLVTVIVLLAGSVVFLLVRDKGGEPTVATTGSSALTASGTVGSGGAAPGSAVGTASANAESAPVVDVAKVRQGAVGRTVRLTGNVAPARDVTLASKVPGTVLWTVGGMGTKVEAGDAIVRLDDTELQLAYEQSKAQHAAAAAQLARLEAGAAGEEIAQVESAVEQARVGLERIAAVLDKQERLYEQGIISEEAILGVRTEHDVARLQFESAQQQLALVKRGATQEERNAARAQVEQANVAVKLAEQQLQDTTITAPFAGMLASRPVQVGTMIGGGTPVGGIVDIDTVIIEANVGERDVNGLRVGQTVNITVDALSGFAVEGVVESVAPVADQQSRSFPVRFAVDNADHRLKPGMVARVEVRLGDGSSATIGTGGSAATGSDLIIPESAVMSRGGRSIVLAVHSDSSGRHVVQERQVRTGERSDGLVIVRSGLAAGDAVILNPSQANVSDGMTVRVAGEDM